RYTRAELLALRYEGKSRLRPPCANQSDLQTLHFWKVNLNAATLNVSSPFATQNKNSLSPEADNAGINSSNNGLISSRRAMRNRERANNYYQRFIPGEFHQLSGEDKESQSTHSSVPGQPFKQAIVDHRSISSSHLMPAFAKRRFAVINVGQLENDSMCESADVSTTNSVSVDRTCTPTQNQGSSTGISTSSPIGNNFDADNFDRRTNYVQPDNDKILASSPTLSNSRQERRIGSGRLPPRNDSWDYKGHKSSESNIEKEKEAPINGIATHHNQNQQRQRIFCGKLGDRLNEQTDRRFHYDRRSSEKQTVGNRRIPNKDLVNNQGRGKRFLHTHDKNEEPEWFSAGPTSQLETIDLHGFDEVESKDPSPELEDHNATFLLNENDMDDINVANNDSRRSSSESIRITDALQLDSSKDRGDDMLSLIPIATELNNQNKIQTSQLTCSQNSGSEFNFDAFLNMNLLDNTLISNDSIAKGEAEGTSRFSRWFRQKENCNNNEGSNLRETHVQEKLGIPNVKDLEAQMTKVDIRTEYAPQIVLPLSSSDHLEKPGPRDTEAFKKLLQQLGSQTRISKKEVYHIVHSSKGQDELESSHLHSKQNECTSQQQTKNVHMTNLLSNSGHVLSPNRMEMQHLIQSKIKIILVISCSFKCFNWYIYLRFFKGLINGDISLDFLEKELTNPTILPSTRDAILTVLREYPQTRRISAVDYNLLPHSPFSQPQPLQQQITEELYPQSSGNNGINHMVPSNSPTPLAFTPTSVLRKMTADKETTHASIANHNQQVQFHNTQHLKQAAHLNEPQEPPTIPAQPRMILGGGNYTMGPIVHQVSGNLPPCRSQPLKWAPSNIQMIHGKTFGNYAIRNAYCYDNIFILGRPILKGGLNSAPQHHPSSPFPQKNDLQSNQHQLHQQPQHHHPLRLKSTQLAESMFTNENVHQNIPLPDAFSQIQHQMFLQHQQVRQHRVIQGELNHPSNLQISAPVAGFPDSSDSKNITSSFHRDDRLPSPTNNQLAQWFSPELLARASAGKLPLLNVNQALSLEEFERSIQHSSAIVHN
ncbi:hypothetical protein KR018_001291, partial [Drosophila ironensis]